MKMKTPKSSVTAEQCREMGLSDGQMIEGQEDYSDGSWQKTRLLLLWLGQQVAVFETWRIFSSQSNPEIWQSIGETSEWDLRVRKWKRVKSGENFVDAK